MDIVSYILSTTFTKKSLEGMGALKGASCTISSIVDNPDGTHDITFSWKDNSDVTHTSVLTVANGETPTITSTEIEGGHTLTFTTTNPSQSVSFNVMDGVEGQRGVSVIRADVDANNYLKLTLSDGNVINAGQIKTVSMVDNTLSLESTNPVENRVITSALNNKVNKVSGKQLSTEDFTTAEKNKLANIENGAQVNTLENLIINGEEATIVDKKIALNIITSAVSNLQNYYLKSETYTKTEVEELIGSTVGVTIEIVQELPTVGQTNVIYFLPTETTNVYSQYIYTANDGWVLIGSTSVDLSNYYTKGQVDTLLNGKQNVLTIDAFPTAMSNNPVASGGVYSAIAQMQPQFQFTNMPVASESNYGFVYQYIGNAGTYEPNMFYRCVYNTYAGEYRWEEVIFHATVTVDSELSATSINPVQNKVVKEALDAKQDIMQFSTMPSAQDNLGKIVQYTGATTATYQNGCFYKAVYDSEHDTYIWTIVRFSADISVDNVLSDVSENPVQNKVITKKFGEYKTAFTGTEEEWNALTSEQQNVYDIVNILEDGQIFNISIPTGGTTGQVLTKKSNSDYDTEWKTAEDVLYPYVDTPFVLNEKAYINKSGRKVTTQGSQWKYSNPIAVTRGQNIKFIASGYETNIAMIATCDIEGNDISVKVVSESNPNGESLYYKTYEYEVTDNGYIVLSCNTQGGEPKLQIKNGTLNANSLISETTFSALCHAFKKVVCVGDSYTEGRIYKTTDESYVDDPDYSWVHYMNDLTGNKWINCGVSGATAKVWQTNKKGLPKAQAEGVSQAYVIGLGINDSSSESYGLPVGTESDIGTDNDTYYAQLSKVIVELATISPNAYIFVNTCPFYNVDRITPYNVAIRAIVEHFKGTYKIHCIDLANEYAYLFYAPNFTAMFYKGHPTVDGHAAIAKKYEFALSNYMKQHEAEFRDISWTQGSWNITDSIDGLEYNYDYQLITPTVTENKLVRVGTGAILNASSYDLAEISVSAGEEYTIVGSINSYAALCVIVDASNNVLYSFPTDTRQYISTNGLKVTIPEGGVKLYSSITHLTQYTHAIHKAIKNSKYTILNKHDVLYGKKWYACGDSFTYGYFGDYTDSDGKKGQFSDAFDDILGCFKTYPWWIRKRCGIEANNTLAVSGVDFTNITGATQPFSAETSPINYTLIPTDCDYITLQFGLNETNLTTEQIGTSADTTNETLWGAYYVVLNSILTANPTVKIGIIISDAWMTQTYHDALIEIAKYWGIPYLDLKNGEEVPMMIGGELRSHSTVATQLRDAAMSFSTNNHPTVKGHEYRSTVIENFLRSL